MKVIITSNIPVLPITLGVELEKNGFSVEHALPEKSHKNSDSLVARYGTGVSQGHLKQLEQFLAPLAFLPVSDPNLEDGVICLNFCFPQDMNAWELTINTDTEQLLSQLKETCFDSFGFSEDETELAVVERNELHYGAAPKEVRQLLRWYLKSQGISVIENQKFTESDTDIHLRIKDPQAEKLPPRERFRVHIATDDFALGKDLGRKLVEQGFRLGEIGALDKDDLKKAPIGFGADWFEKGFFPGEIMDLRSMLVDFSRQQGIDQDRYPVLACDDLSAGMDAVISLPVRACLDKTRRPYAGPFPERFALTVYLEGGSVHQGMEKAFNEIGFEKITFTEMDENDRMKGFRVVCKQENVDPEIFGLVREKVLASMKADEIPDIYELDTEFKRLSLDSIQCDEDEIRIFYPLEGARSGRLLEEQAAPKNWECYLKCANPAEWEKERDSLKAWGFKSLSLDDSPEEKPRLQYGGAPLALLERIEAHFREIYGIEFSRMKSWGKNDDDIYVCLPPRSSLKSPGMPTKANHDWREWLAPVSKPGRSRSFLQRSKKSLRIGELELPVFGGGRHPLTPDLETFSHFCLDQKTAETLHHLAMSLILKEPCLLEGETSSSKTSSILYLAALQNAPILRMNLNGQTDTSELIGRFIPLIREGGPTGWQWQDGLLPQAMKNGWRLLYDEYNLGAPEIRERDNSAREFPPSLTLTEFDNTVIGSTEHPVHPDFALFATMNPAEYAGRQSLSPADRDRWRGYRFVPSPDEEDYAQMLVYLATGEQPVFELGGISYRGRKGAPPIPHLAQIPEIKKVARILASMHSALERAANTDEGLGSQRKDAFVVTRRGLISLMLYLAHSLAHEKSPLVERSLRQALYRYYLARATSRDEREAIMGIFDAAGLGNHSWSLS